MARPRRSDKSSAGEFQDPLKNYEVPEYADELERDLVEAQIDAMDVRPVTTLPLDTTIEQAMRKMADLEIGCTVIVDDDGRLAGIFTARDVLDKVAVRFDQIKDSAVSTVMTDSPMAAYTADSPGKAMNLMAIGGFRHVPILDVDDKVIGILGPRRISQFLEAYLQ